MACKLWFQASLGGGGGGGGGMESAQQTLATSRLAESKPTPIVDWLNPMESKLAGSNGIQTYTNSGLAESNGIQTYTK